MNLIDTLPEVPEEVRVVAVSKYVPCGTMVHYHNLGYKDFGENRVQDALDKANQLPGDLTWHLIGHLQSNKVKSALERFDWIHSVHSEQLLRRLDRLAAELSREPNLLLQVKLLPDPNKFGLDETEAERLLELAEDLHNVRLRGFMTILPRELSLAERQQTFRRLRKLRDRCLSKPYQSVVPKELSMGMSDDYREAIREGATMVRLGRALFQACG